MTQRQVLLSASFGAMVLIAIGAVALPKHPGIAVGLPYYVVVLALVGVTSGVAVSGTFRRRDDLHRWVMVESTSVAFYVVMFGCLAYALSESYLGAPPLSAWWPWTIGVTAWVALASRKGRRVEG